MTISSLLGQVVGVIGAHRYDVGVMIGAVLFELAVRSRLARPLIAQGYVVDLTYCAFYRLGVYALLLDRPIQDFVTAHLTWQLILGAPTWLRVIAYLIVLDFVQYWVHRLEHAVPALWAVHQVHHSQAHMSIMTTYRVHPVDMWLRGFFGPVVFMIIFGVPPVIWLPLTLFWEVVLNVTHLEVNWTYGPLRWLLVSPVSHAIHHSVEDRHQSKNHGMVLVIWDRLFGTADTGTLRPAAVGLPGWRVPDSPLAHLWAPIRGVIRHYRGLPVEDLAPLAPPPNTTSTRPAP